MLNQGFQSPQLITNNGLATRFAAPTGGIADDQPLWLQPRAASTTTFGMKGPEVQLMQGQQVYGANAGFKQAGMQGLPFVGNEAEYGRQQNNIPLGYVQQQQNVPNNMGQFAPRVAAQNTIGGSNAPWQLLQQQSNANISQQNYGGANVNQLYMQQNLAGGGASTLEAAKLVQSNAIAAAAAQQRAMQLQQGGHVGMQGQYGNSAVVNVLNKPSVLPNTRLVSGMNPASRVPTNRVAMPGMQPLNSLGGGYANLGNQGLMSMNSGLVGQGMNSMLNNAVVAQHRDALLQQQQQQQAALHAQAAAARMHQQQQQLQQVQQNMARAANYHMNQLALATTSAMAFNAPMTTTSMMMDNQATLLKLQQQQQNGIMKANLDALTSADPRSLAAGITQADLMFNNRNVNAHAGRPVASVAQPHAQLVSQYVTQAQAQAARRSPFDNLATSLVTSAPQDQVLTPSMYKVPGGGAQMAAISRPMPAASVRPVPVDMPGSAQGFQAASGNNSTISMLSQLQLGTKTAAPDVRISEGAPVTEPVVKATPPEELDVVLAYVGENFARMNITIDQAIAHGILGGLGAAQVKIVRDAHDAELNRMRSAAAAAAAAEQPAAGNALAQPDSGEAPATSPRAIPSGQVPVTAATADDGQPGGAVVADDSLAPRAVVPQDSQQAATGADLPAGAVAAVPAEDNTSNAENGALSSAADDAPEDNKAVSDVVSSVAAVAMGGSEDMSFDAFSYGFFGGMVPDSADNSLLEALEPDDSNEGENGAQQHIEDGGLELKSADCTASDDAEWAASKAMSQELNLDKAVGDDVLSSKFHRLDLGCGFN